MPDTLKQFYNATINVTGLTGAQTAPLFTNSATTRAVIKDIDVANTFPITPNLTVAGTAVAGLSANLTGSEIVDVSQAVQISFPSALVYTSTTTIVLSAATTQRISTAYSITGTQVSTTAVDQTLPALEGGATYSTVVYYAPDGDVFSAQTNGTDTNFLLKNAGSAGGTRTTINTGNTTNFSPIAFDGVNTFYWLSSTTNLRAFNADTETTTNTTVATLPAGSTQARLLHSNGYLLYGHQPLANPYIIEISTGRWAYCTGVGLNSDQNNQVPGFWFEPSTRVATLMTYYSPVTLYYRYVSPAIPAFTTASVTFADGWSSLTLAPGSFVNNTASNGQVHVVLSSADGGVIHNSSSFAYGLSGISGPTSGWTLSPSLSGVGSAVWRPRRSASSSPTVNTTNFPNTISLRVTGVEVTP